MLTEIAARPDTLVIVAPDLEPFYRFLKPRQEADDRSLVVLLDQRRGERRQGVESVTVDRRGTERRAQPAAAARALMAVLGFSILHREGDRYTA